VNTDTGAKVLFAVYLVLVVGLLAYFIVLGVLGV
jgi:hypothetical protein